MKTKLQRAVDATLEKYRRRITISTPLLGRRWWRHFWQRRYRGFDDSVTWNLDVEMARWLLPRLKRFKEVTICYPDTLTENQWSEYLDEMIFAVEQVADHFRENDLSIEKMRKIRPRIDNGLMLLGKYFQHLWW